MQIIDKVLLVSKVMNPRSVQVYYHATSFKPLQHTVRYSILVRCKTLIDDVFLNDALVVVEHQIQTGTRASRRARSWALSSKACRPPPLNIFVLVPQLLALDQKLWLVLVEELGQIFTGVSIKNMYCTTTSTGTCRRCATSRGNSGWPSGNRARSTRYGRVNFSEQKREGELEDKSEGVDEVENEDNGAEDAQAHGHPLLSSSSNINQIDFLLITDCVLIYVHVSTLRLGKSVTLKQ